MGEKALIRNVRGPEPRIFVLAGKFESCVDSLAETGEVYGPCFKKRCSMAMEPRRAMRLVGGWGIRGQI